MRNVRITVKPDQATRAFITIITMLKVLNLPLLPSRHSSVHQLELYGQMINNQIKMNREVRLNQTVY